ncbi:hypothetical protein [Streptomyces sp. NBC_00239]|uniref:hypothetical protein n=1 Tax=Streptomyces sp. NBC_00239 TaxID=2903640 RepID=UPI002E2875E7|nr:hypothetical protein [Streptomyces sp. NBC_00239]
MSAERPTLPPVRLHSDAELARDALGTPLLARAVRLARWAGPATRVGAGGELVEELLPQAAVHLGLDEDPEGLAYASEAWRIAVDTGLVEVTEEAEDTGGAGDTGGTVVHGEELGLVAGGAPADVLDLWLTALDAVLADAAVPDLDDLVDALDSGGEIDFGRLDWDPQRESEFLDGVLANLYLLTVAEGGAAHGPVPLPVLAASMIVPDDMADPTDEVLEQVSDAMMRLDDQFRQLEPIGLVEYRPVDEALMAEVDESDEAYADGAFGDGALPAGAQGVPGAGAGQGGEDAEDVEDVSRYGLVRLTPLGLFGVRARMQEAGVEAPAVGDFADKGADALLDAVSYFSEDTAQAEIEQWLARREVPGAAAELLAAARGGDAGGPLRRLRCQQALALTDGAAEPAVRAVLDDPELGGLARVWLAERGAADVPVPDQAMVFWLTVDTISAQLAADGETEGLAALMAGLTEGHSGFFDAAWRVAHPATAEVLEAMGRLHPDKKAAKEARKAAFKARSRQG